MTDGKKTSPMLNCISPFPGSRIRIQPIASATAASTSNNNLRTKACSAKHGRLSDYKDAVGGGGGRGQGNQEKRGWEVYGMQENRGKLHNNV